MALSHGTRSIAPFLTRLSKAGESWTTGQRESEFLRSLGMAESGGRGVGRTVFGAPPKVAARSLSEYR